VRYSLAHLRGALIGRIQNGTAVHQGVLDQAVNDAYEEIVQRVKQAHSRKLRTIWEMDLIAGQAAYEWPDDLDAIESMARRDIETRPVPVGRYDQARAHEVQTLSSRENVTPPNTNAQPYSYFEAGPRLLQLVQAPAVAYVGGLVIRGWPRPVPLSEDAHEPALPESLHEHIVSTALVRLRTQEGVFLTDQRNIDKYINRMDNLLMNMLAPDHYDIGGTDIADEGDIW